MSLILTGILASLAAGAATGIGALPALVLSGVSVRLQDALLGFAAGVMLAASFFSLIIPGLDYATGQYGGPVTGAAVIAAGVLIGAIAIQVINEWVPHEHFVLGRQGPVRPALARIWLFIVAITLHNFPEGMAVGVGFGGGDIARGTTLAIGIGLQNMPEGLAVAVALMREGYGRLYAATVALMTGLVEPIGGALGISVVVLAEPLLPWGLAFAAGAMIFIISHEIIPETHSRGNQSIATGGLMTGLVVMMFLDVTLGG